MGIAPDEGIVLEILAPQDVAPRIEGSLDDERVPEGKGVFLVRGDGVDDEVRRLRDDFKPARRNRN